MDEYLWKIIFLSTSMTLKNSLSVALSRLPALGAVLIAYGIIVIFAGHGAGPVAVTRYSDSEPFVYAASGGVVARPPRRIQPRTWG
jgi:hypothetical protein